MSPWETDWNFAAALCELPRRGNSPPRALHWNAAFNGMHLVGHDHWACRIYRLPRTHYCHGAPRSSRPTLERRVQRDAPCRARPPGVPLAGDFPAHATATARRGRRALHWDAAFNGMHLVGHDHRACRLQGLPCTHYSHSAPGLLRPTGQAIHPLATYRIGMDNCQFPRLVAKKVIILPISILQYSYKMLK